MNPRLFCREQSYHKALLLTYSFDPMFFEHVVLPDLWAGRSSDILVLADRDQIDASMQTVSGQLSHLGKKYLLAGAKHAGAFHPKVFLRLGPKDGAIMVGSGNITSSGWGGNQEVATAWSVGPDHADKGGWLHALFDDVLSWCDGELEIDAVRRMKDVPWLSMTPFASNDIAPILHSRKGGSLGPRLAERWSGRQFDEIKILTGSTDESGAFLRWAHTTFGVTRATIALTPSAASFHPEKLADLPLELRVIAVPTEQSPAARSEGPLHAKFYWFDSADGPAAIMGSANCSAAAWLQPPSQGGNVETIVVYDAPTDEEFASILATFSTPSQSPTEVLSPKAEREKDKEIAGKRYAIASLSWDSTASGLYAEIEPAPSAAMTVDLIVDGVRYAMIRSGSSDGLWECELPEGIGASTQFAAARVHGEESSWTTAKRWINDVTALLNASQSARLLGPFKGLARSGSSAEQRQMLNDLSEVARTLFSESASFQDISFRPAPPKDSKGEQQPCAPVNPHDLIFYLEELPRPLPIIGSVSAGNLSLTGILQVLFGSEGDEDASPSAAIDEQLDEGQLPDEIENKEPATKQVNPDLAPVEAQFQKRLDAQIEAFLGELASADFSQRCTATQMVQAVSFPLAVALRGRDRGWVSHEMAEKWAREVFSVLFRSAGAGARGLLHDVEERYEDAGHRETFNGVVGDGTLWLVLVATLGKADWRDVGTDFEKVLAIREVFTAPQLLASAESERVAGLLGKIRIDHARSYIGDVAPRATRLLHDIEGLLSPIWNAEIQNQTERPIIHKVGDLLWRENAGWAICLADTDAREGPNIKARLRGQEKRLGMGYHVNVSELATRRSDLLRLLDQLHQVVSCSIDAVVHSKRSL